MFYIVNYFPGNIASTSWNTPDVDRSRATRDWGTSSVIELSISVLLVLAVPVVILRVLFDRGRTVFSWSIGLDTLW